MSKFLTYKKFQTTEEASELIDILKQNKIAFEMEDNSGNISDFIVGQDVQSNIVVKIHPDNFTAVNQLLETNAESFIDSVDKNYHLFSFDNEELLEIVSEPDSWCELDKQLAKKILSDRGIPITKELEETFYNKRLKELSVKESGGTIWTTLGYISALLGGFLGIAIGLSLWAAKRTLPNGQRVYVYHDSDRMHGQVITIIGLVMLCVGLYLQIRFRVF